MKKLYFLGAFILAVMVNGQTFTQAYQDRVNQISQNNLNNYLTEFASFGIKTTGSTNNNDAFNWLKQKYSSFGFSSEQLSENAFTYNGNPTKNLIVTKTGTKYPQKFIIVCGHYDTIGGQGVNDNGSGTAVILEMARILKDIPTEYSIKFIHFSGEEQGLLGSRHYVNTVVNGTNPKMDIKLVLNIDQVGGIAGQINNTITCERDTNNTPSNNNSASAQATQELINTIKLYSPLQTNLSYAYGSDYIPFENNGEVITGLYEFKESSTPHTASDTYANMDPVFVYNVTKGALGGLQYFSLADTNLSVKENLDLNKISIFPVPTKGMLHLEFPTYLKDDFRFSLHDSSGKLVLNVKNKHQIDVSKLDSGVYIGTFSVKDQTFTRKVIIAH